MASPPPDGEVAVLPVAPEVAALRARVRRAFGDRTPLEVASSYRAIVGPTRSEDALVQGALEALNNGQKPTPLQSAALEEAIRVFRPAILSVGRVLSATAEQRASFPEWDTFCTSVAPHLYAVGRIDRGPRAPGSVPASVGTGFLVAPTVLVTNRHVLEILSLGGMDLEPGMAIVTFQEEYGVINDEGVVSVTALLAVHPTLDLAIFAVEPRGLSAGRAPWAIDAAPPAVGNSVAVVGYPFQDAERNPLFVNTLFQGIFGMKRAAPGEVIGLRDDVIYHDCSTLGGNSGSPLLEMGSGRVIGVQARGGFLVRNTAVSGAALAAFVAPFT